MSLPVRQYIGDIDGENADQFEHLILCCVDWLGVEQTMSFKLIAKSANMSPNKFFDHAMDAVKRKLNFLMNGAAEQSNFNKRRHELSVAILEASLSFAGSLAKELDDLIERQPNRSSTFYRRIIAHGPDEPSWTHTDQCVLLLGGLSFFLYVLDWLLFQRGNERLMASIFDPIAGSLNDVLTKIRNEMNPKEPITKNHTHDIIAELHARYAKGTTAVRQK